MATRSLSPRVPFHHDSLSQWQSVSILSGAAIMLSLAMGMRQSLGLFMQPITRDIGISAADFAFALAVQNIVWGIAQPFAGALVDKFGTRFIALFGGAAMGQSITQLISGRSIALGRCRDCHSGRYCLADDSV